MTLQIVNLTKVNSMRKEFVICGNNFNNLNGFYDEVEAVFTSKLSWKIGRSLDAFNDILRGSFGRHEDNESNLIRWINYRKSEHILSLENILTKFDMKHIMYS